MSGKGDDPRPSSVSRDTWDKNWSRAFGKKKPAKSKGKIKRLPPGTY